MKIKNITVVTCTRDRSAQLKQTLSHVKNINNLKEHLIIDWNSESNLKLNNNEKEKTSIYKVLNENRWWLTRAYNTGFFVAETEYILKLDADVKINYKKFNNLDYTKYDIIVFFDSPNDPGNFLIKKEILNKINGFNEYMWEWGWSDHDLILRAKNLTNNIKFLDAYGYIDKIEHDNSSRSIVKKNQIYKNTEQFYYSLIKAHNDTNAFLSKEKLWSLDNKLNYKIKDNKIIVKHFFTIKDLNFYLKLKYKFNILMSFFKIYKKESRFEKRILPFLLLLLPNNILFKFFSIQIYPKIIK